MGSYMSPMDSNPSSSRSTTSLACTSSSKITQLKMLQALYSKLTSKHPSLRKQLFNKQVDFVKDTNRYKTAVCSRRAGKSFALATYLADTALTYPRTLNPYIGLTRKSAKRIMWPIFKRILTDSGIKCQFKEADLEIHFDNGSMIFLCGANDESTSENLRGNPYKLVCIDECASYRGHIDTLVDEILIPALVDHRGSMCLVGTPSPDFESYFYRATTDKKLGWSTHHWSLFDNPFITDAKEFIDDLKQKRGWTDDNPILLREYYGVWTRSLDDLVYKFNPLKNVFSELPSHKMNYVVGLDIGHNDATAFSVLGFNLDASPNVYLVESLRLTKAVVSDIQVHLLNFVAKYSPISVVADSGALGKMIVEELMQRTSLLINAAEKIGKMAFIEVMNSDLRAGKIKVAEDADVIEEWKSLMILKNAQGKMVEDPREKNDLSDSFLYAYRECKHYLHRDKTPEVKYGTKEYFDKEEQRMLEEAERKHRGPIDY